MLTSMKGHRIGLPEIDATLLKDDGFLFFKKLHFSELFFGQVEHSNNNDVKQFRKLNCFIFE